MKVLFVCMGNICRSPTAEGVFRKMASEQLPNHDITVDSAGTHAYHRKEPPDRRAQTAAERRGVDLSKQRARILMDDDFRNFDYIIGMDADNLDKLIERCPTEYQSKVSLFMSFAPESDYTEVPDPYFGGPSGFEKVLDLVEEAAQGLIEQIRRK
ncbi:MAG: low molecular weight protein-tyrosine-phosphatase [Pseudomonadota bacterium]